MPQSCRQLHVIFSFFGHHAPVVVKRLSSFILACLAMSNIAFVQTCYVIFMKLLKDLPGIHNTQNWLVALLFILNIEDLTRVVISYEIY